MNKLKKTIAVTCIAILTSPLHAGEVELQRRIAELGQGAELRLTLKDGSKPRGNVEQIGPEAVMLRVATHRPARSIPYHQIDSIDPVKRVYRSNSGRNPIAAYRVAVSLGPGHHVLTRVRTGTTYRGHIEAIDQRGFSLLADRTGETVRIEYDQIDHLEQNLSRLAKIAIIAGIGAGVLTVVYLRIVLDPNY